MTSSANDPISFSPAYPVPLNEHNRLQALQALGLLDTPAENALDSVVRQAASICKTPIALISLVDRDRQWFKARVGLELQETPRCASFCAHAILDTQLFEVMDARADARFTDGPLVTGKTDVRFYAGMPLVTADGLALGTLCVMDHERRVLSSKQRESLRDLATMVTALLDSRKVAATAVQLSLILHEAFDEIIVLHPGSQQIQFANERASGNLGYGVDDLQQMSLPSIGPDYPLSKLQKLCGDAVHGDRAPLHFEASNIRKDGSTYPVEVRATVSSGGAQTQVLLLVNDISERKINQEQFGDLVAYDSVTKLANRGNLEVRLAGAMRRTNASDKPLALMMIEINGFTEIRHSYGQQLANNVLADFAARLKACARSHDVVAHLGGDEFVILISSVEHPNATASLTNRIHRKMEKCFLWEQCQIPLAASIGVVEYAGGDEDMEALMARAADAVNVGILNSRREPTTALLGGAADMGIRTLSRLRLAVGTFASAVH